MSKCYPDCCHVVSFADGLRIACNCSHLPADEVYKYQPLNKADAGRCVYFNSGREFSENDLTEAEVPAMKVEWVESHTESVDFGYCEALRVWAREHSRKEA